MTGIAAVEGELSPPRRAIGRSGMALFAPNLRVRPGERKSRLRVVEVGDVSPSRRAVALLAGVSQPSFVVVLMAAGAVLRETEEGSIQILNLDRRFCGWEDLRGGVTLIAA